MIRVTIESIRVDSRNEQYVVILKEESEERYLPIWIGPAEAEAIAIELQGVEVPRPLTHDLLYSVIHTLGAGVDSVVVSELEGNTFHAKVILRANGEQTEVDCRPSDALALAVRAQIPVFAEEPILDKAGIWLDRETGRPTPGDQKSETDDERGVSQEELQRMSAFADFIKGLDLDDIDKREG